MARLKTRDALLVEAREFGIKDPESLAATDLKKVVGLFRFMAAVRTEAKSLGITLSTDIRQRDTLMRVYDEKLAAVLQKLGVGVNSEILHQGETRIIERRIAPRRGKLTTYVVATASGNKPRMHVEANRVLIWLREAGLYECKGRRKG